MKRVYLFCSAGMSTSMLASKMQDVANSHDLPIVLNPMILIPFMLVPTINIVISYFCMSIGLVPLCTGVAIPWTMPVVLSGFLATGWQGAVLQLLLLILGVFIYMPFIKMMDKQYLEDEAKASDKSDDDDIDFDDLSFDDL